MMLLFLLIPHASNVPMRTLTLVTIPTETPDLHVHVGAS